MSESPLVSIIIPTCNRSYLLDRAITSVIGQDYENWQCLIVNDAGESLDEIEEKYRTNKKIQFLQHTFKKGPGAARNTALRIASGDIIAYLDDDDIYLPGHVKTLVDFIQANNLDFAFSLGTLVFENETLEEIERDNHYARVDTTEDSMHVTNSIPVIACAHTRLSLEEAGYFDEVLESFEDWDFILRYIRDKRCGLVSEYTYEIRRRVGDTENVTRSNTGSHINNYELIYQRYPSDSELISQQRKETLKTLREYFTHEQLKSGLIQSQAGMLSDIFENEVDIDFLYSRYRIDRMNNDYLGKYDELIQDISNDDLLEKSINATLVYLENNTASADGHILLGRLLMQAGNYQAAEISFRNSLLINRDYYEAILYQMQCLVNTDRKNAAAAIIDNIHFQGAINCDVLYHILKQYSAIADVSKSLVFSQSMMKQTACKNEKIFNHVGNLFYQCEQFTDAKAFYIKAIEKNPSYEDADTNLRLVNLILENKELPLVLVLPKGENYGWGVCSSYLRKELGNKTDVFSLEYDDWGENGNKYIPGLVFTSIGAESLDLIYPVKGKINIGYTFFERDLSTEAVNNARFFDLVLAGSSWAVEQLQQMGIQNCDVLVQGIDETLFYPVENKQHEGFFIFSGGKFELRKSQDLVLKAVSYLQQKYDDIILVNAWVNYWPQSMLTMSYSPHIKYEYSEGDWSSIMSHIYEINGLDAEKIITCEIVPHEELRDLFSKTDIGIFPNRSEGGTNLVLMEYMACSKPVIATYCTGHKDVITDKNSLLLENNSIKEYRDENNVHYATWDEPDLHELIEKIEYAYHNRIEIENLGKQAGIDLAKFTWSHMADNLLSTLNEWGFLK